MSDTDSVSLRLAFFGLTVVFSVFALRKPLHDFLHHPFHHASSAVSMHGPSQWKLYGQALPHRAVRSRGAFGALCGSDRGLFDACTLSRRALPLWFSLGANVQRFMVFLDAFWGPKSRSISFQVSALFKTSNSSISRCDMWKSLWLILLAYSGLGTRLTGTYVLNFLGFCRGFLTFYISLKWSAACWCDVNKSAAVFGCIVWGTECTLNWLILFCIAIFKEYNVRVLWCLSIPTVQGHVMWYNALVGMNAIYISLLHTLTWTWRSTGLFTWLGP